MYVYGSFLKPLCWSLLTAIAALYIQGRHCLQNKKLSTFFNLPPFSFTLSSSLSLFIIFFSELLPLLLLLLLPLLLLFLLLLLHSNYSPPATPHQPPPTNIPKNKHTNKTKYNLIHQLKAIDLPTLFCQNISHEFIYIILADFDSVDFE